MKRALLVARFFLVLSVALGALYYTQRHNKQAPVSPNAVLEMRLCCCYVRARQPSLAPQMP